MGGDPDFVDGRHCVPAVDLLPGYNGVRRGEGAAGSLPETEQIREVPQKNILHIVVQPNGVVRLKRGESPQEQLIQPAQLGTIWRSESSQNPNLIAAVKTDPAAPYKHMVEVLDALQHTGATRISLQIVE